MKLGSILVGTLALSNVSKINTDQIKPLMEAISVDAIQPLVLLIIAEVIIIIPTTLGFFLVIFCDAGKKKVLLLTVSIDQLFGK